MTSLPPFKPLAEQWIRKEKIIPVLVGVLAVILLPYFHLGVLYSFWAPEKAPVKTSSCTCECWDTIFKGSYEKNFGRYKHVYFNVTSNTLKIWACTVIFAIALYESLCYLIRLYFSGRLRFSMFLLYAVVLYPHYYSWWSYFNYTNDDFYEQWNHQTFFSVTEMISTFMVIYLCDKKRETLPNYMLLIISVAVLHILASGADQFVNNVLMGNGELYKIFRDLGFMAPDLVNIAIPLWLWWDWAKKNAVPFRQSITMVELLFAFVMITLLLLLCSVL